jgi:hypothetical protein
MITISLDYKAKIALLVACAVVAGSEIERLFQYSFMGQTLRFLVALLVTVIITRTKK